MRKLISSILFYITLINSLLAAPLELNQLALPSDVKNIQKKGGSVFYSPTTKGKPLIPVHFWGEVKNSGLHYVPIGTNLIKGISLAGGLTSSADMENVKLTRLNDGKVSELNFDLSAGGSYRSIAQELRPGDTIFVKKSYYLENRVFYMSIVGVLTTILSGYVLLKNLN